MNRESVTAAEAERIRIITAENYALIKNRSPVAEVAGEHADPLTTPLARADDLLDLLREDRQPAGPPLTAEELKSLALSLFPETRK